MKMRFQWKINKTSYKRWKEAHFERKNDRRKKNGWTQEKKEALFIIINVMSFWQKSDIDKAGEREREREWAAAALRIPLCRNLWNKDEVDASSSTFFSFRTLIMVWSMVVD